MVTLTDLPPDVLYNIFPYLDAAQFLSLTSTNKILQTYRQDPNFWRSLTRTTFRIPPQPLLQANNGTRWQWLYRRLRTQTQLYTWGSNGCGNLGHEDPGNHMHGHPTIDDSHGQPRNVDANRRNVGWPLKVPLEEMPEDIGIVADVQCGGWSTTLLNSNGCLYICGGVDESTAWMTRSVRRDPNRSRATTARQLKFPSAYPPTTKDRHEPSTAIAQFSCGRKHILGLADDGKVWQWVSDSAYLIKPLHVDVTQQCVKRVVAGWDRASMYVTGTGIIYWPDDSPSRSTPVDADAVLIDSVTIPGTSFPHSSSDREDSGTLAAQIGEVANHVILENYIVFATKLNKIFFYRTDFPFSELDPPQPIELTVFYSATPEVLFEVRDIQGSFRSFAIFTNAGGVLMGNRAMLDAFFAASNESPAASSSAPSSPSLPQPTIIPALQNNSITSIAFGDHHFHALKSDGTTFAYGADPQCCGALGLGFLHDTGPLRGLLAARDHFGANGTLGANVSRQVWFDVTMHRWLADMMVKAYAAEGEARARVEMIFGQHTDAVMATGDYFEREGRKWEDGVKEEGENETEREREMGSYFVLKVAAAGWHSAALVLVDEAKAERARLTHIVPSSPPLSSEAEEMRKAEEGGDDGRNEQLDHHDEHGGTWEDIDPPWDQLSKAVLAPLTWLWVLAMWFLGLRERDERLEAERVRRREGEEGAAAGKREGTELQNDDADVRYFWSEQPIPRLRMANGEVMPGEVDVME